MEAYVVEIVLAVITTILTTIAGLWIKHLYKKMNEKEERAKREAAEKIVNVYGAQAFFLCPFLVQSLKFL